MTRYLIAIGLALLVVGEARAQVPSPANSVCPSAVMVTPTAACCFDVIVRDALNNPIPGSTVRVDFGTCAVTLCPTQPPGITVVGNGVQAVTNALGVARFCICGTFQPPCTATIFADGILLCSVPMANNCGPTANRTTFWGRVKVIYR
jgi:hypothetical protein